MNKTKIDWADMTWNPVTGCLHGCEYCYARKIAKRFDGTKAFPNGFEPTIHNDRLIEPQKVEKPQNIFVCSMADLFGSWVPESWIEQVFDACKKAPQHNYLFLTKNPLRIIDEDTPTAKNMWFGSSFTRNSDDFVSNRRKSNPERNYFLSIEPILEDVLTDLATIHCFERVNWVIVGAETGNRTNKVIPKKEWIDKIVYHCKEAGIPLFMKDSIRELMGNEFAQELPEGLMK